MNSKKINIYSYSNYTDYLKDLIKNCPNNGRGIKSTLSKLLGCKPSYISHILSERLYLSPEQAFKISNFFMLDNGETNLFLTLVNHSRAETKQLKRQIQNQINYIRKTELSIGEFSSKSNDSEHIMEHESLGELANSWIYTAIILKINHETNGTSYYKLSEKLKIDVQILKEAAKILNKRGYIEIKGEYIFPKDKTVSYLTSGLMENRNLHLTWRNKILNDIQVDSKHNNLHITFPIATTKEVLKQFEEILMKATTKMKDILDESMDDKNYPLDECSIVSIDIVKF